MKNIISKITGAFKKIPGMSQMNEITVENDIRYKGPLSYRHLRIIAWIMLAAIQAYAFFVRDSIRTGKDLKFGAGAMIIYGLSYIVAPLFLFAVFSLILDGHERYKNLIILYSVCFIFITGLFIFVYEHYILGLYQRLWIQQNRYQEKMQCSL